MVQTKSYPDEVRFQTLFERDVPISKMFIDGRDKGGYARPLNQTRLKDLVDNFDPMALGIVLLSLRANGEYAQIDGQHRTAACTVHGVAKMDALVYIDLTREEEARLYRKFGTHLSQTARDRWAAALVEKDKSVLALQKIVHDEGLRVTVTGGQTPDGIQAVEALIWVAKESVDLLRATLRLLKDCFGSDPKAYTSSMIRGAAAFVARYQNDPHYLRDKLVERLQAKGARPALQSRANYIASMEKGGPSSAIGKAFKHYHDHGNRVNKLPEWQAVHHSDAVKARNIENLRTKAIPARMAKQRATGRKIGGYNNGTVLKDAAPLLALNEQPGKRPRKVR